jgi:hypothetical protein
MKTVDLLKQCAPMLGFSPSMPSNSPLLWGAVLLLVSLGCAPVEVPVTRRVEVRRPRSVRVASPPPVEARSERAEPATSIVLWPGCAKFLEDKTCNRNCWDFLLSRRIMGDCLDPRASAEENATLALTAGASEDDPFIPMCRSGCEKIEDLTRDAAAAQKEKDRKSIAECEYERGQGNSVCRELARSIVRDQESARELCVPRCAENWWRRTHEADAKFLRESSARQNCENGRVVGDCFPVLAYLDSCERMSPLDGKPRPDSCPDYAELVLLRAKKLAQFGSSDAVVPSSTAPPTTMPASPREDISKPPAPAGPTKPAGLIRNAPF